MFLTKTRLYLLPMQPPARLERIFWEDRGEVSVNKTPTAHKNLHRNMYPPISRICKVCQNCQKLLHRLYIWLFLGSFSRTPKLLHPWTQLSGRYGKMVTHAQAMYSLPISTPLESASLHAHIFPLNWPEKRQRHSPLPVLLVMIIKIGSMLPISCSFNGLRWSGPFSLTSGTKEKSKLINIYNIYYIQQKSARPDQEMFWTA